MLKQRPAQPDGQIAAVYLSYCGIALRPSRGRGKNAPAKQAKRGDD
jgi:hypothetical protein